MNIPYLAFNVMHQSIRTEMIDAFTRFYDSNWYVLGDQVESFERRYSEYFSCNYTVGLSNGLDALRLALHALGVQEGDEVIVPANTYIATLLAVTFVGAKPVLVEPDPLTYNIDTARIAEAITSRTKVILPVHLYGQAADMEAILNVASNNNLVVVEDNAQAHGAKWSDKYTGSWGHINATSFYPSKNLGALGEAGAITTDNEALAKLVRKLRNYGSEVKYQNDILGFNMRLDECQAAFLNIKLDYLQKWTNERQVIASTYNKLLTGVGDLILPYTHLKASHVFHIFPVQTNYRSALQKHLTLDGIGTLIHYPVPPHLQKAYAFLNKLEGNYPITENLAKKVLSLPIWPGMTPEQIEHVVNSVKSFFNHAP